MTEEAKSSDDSDLETTVPASNNTYYPPTLQQHQQSLAIPKQEPRPDNPFPPPQHHQSHQPLHHPSPHHHQLSTHHHAQLTNHYQIPSYSSPTAHSRVGTDASEREKEKTIIFFGESNLLTSVAAGEAGDASHAPSETVPHARRESTRLCYPISEAIRDRASRMSFSTGSRASAADYLTREGAFALPGERVCDAILHAYFTWFHPCFPVVDRVSTSAAYAGRALSPLLLNALLFIGSTYASAELLVEAGFRERHDAKSRFYHRAKLLYDADWEEDKVVVLQALFLISFWRAGPLNEKDTRHWLGAAIGLAQARGLHRLYVSFLSFLSLLRSYLRHRHFQTNITSPAHASQTQTQPKSSSASASGGLCTSATGSAPPRSACPRASATRTATLPC